MILSNIKEFLGRNKKILYYFSLFFIVSFLISDTTFAITQITIWETDNTAQSIAKWVNAWLKFVSLFLWLLSYLATMFLSPEWINWSLFWMNKEFKTIWIMVSNIVYFIFAFLLIWIAFMNIIWKNTDQYQLKQALPKFIVWVLIVPFSWFLVQFILSISAILTVSALTLPYDSFPDKYASAVDKIMVPKECTLDLSKELKDKEYLNCWDENNKISLWTLLVNWSSSSSIYWILSFYTYWVMWATDADTIKFSDKEISWYKSIADIAFKLVFDVLFVILYFILIVALWLVLMIRWIYIWIYIMLSPVFWLMYFFDKKDWWDWFFAKFNLKEFIALAMVPVYTMLALSFWMLFMYIVWTWLTLNEWTWVKSSSFTIDNSAIKDKWSIIRIWEKWKDNSISFAIKWATWTASTNLMEMVWNAKDNVLWIIGMLILKLFWIVVLWWTVMAAMRTSEITKTVVEPLHQFGNNVWWIMKSAPWNIPIFGGQSMKSMSSASSTIKSTIDWKSSTKWADFAWKFINQDKSIRKIEDSVRWITKSSDKIAKTKAAEEVISSTDTTNKRQVEAMVKALTQIWFKDLDIDKILNKSTNEIATHLYTWAKWADLGTSLDQYWEFVDRINIAKWNKATKWVWDNRSFDSTKKEFDSIQADDIRDVKVKLDDESITWVGSMYIKAVNWTYEKISIDMKVNKDTTFDKMRPSDKKELADIYQNLTPEQQEEFDKIIWKLWIWDWVWDDFKKAIRQYIKENKK